MPVPVKQMTSARRILWSAAGLLLAALLASACGEGGRLIIDLERPSHALDPIADPRLSKFSLRITVGGRPTVHDAFRNGDAELFLGDVPVGSPFDLRLSGTSATGLMLGLGLVQDVLISDGRQDTVVAVKFRKPLGYVAGQSSVQVLDTAAASSATLELQPLALGGGRAVVATPNGVLVLVLSGNTLVPLRTLDHVKLSPVPLAGSGDHVAVSPDSRYAVICHKSSRKLGVVDLLEVLKGKATETTLSLGGTPSRVVFGKNHTTATLLVDGLERGDTCGSKHGRLVEINLAARTYTPPVSLGRPVADVALDPRDGALLAALTCDKKLRRVAPNKIIQDVAAPTSYDIAINDRNIVLLGRAAGAKVQGQAMLFDLAGSGVTGLGTPQSKTFSFPPLAIGFKSQGSAGYFTWASEPKAFKFYDLSISPDSQRAIALFQVDYQSDMQGSCTYRAKVRGTGYMLLDLATGVVLVHRFTSLVFDKCYANCLVNPSNQYLTTLGVCTAEFKRVLRKHKLLLSGTKEFEPKGSALLFGGN